MEQRRRLRRIRKEFVVRFSERTARYQPLFDGDGEFSLRGHEYGSTRFRSAGAAFGLQEIC